ncbi:hypothetical protein ACHAXT_000178 [Thalassiosira profunda]
MPPSLDPAAATGASASHRHVDSAHSSKASPLRTVLAEARSNLWSAQPLTCHAIFDPLRDFVFDPALAVAAVLLPPLLGGRPGLEKFIANFLRVAIFVPLKTVYCRFPETASDGGGDNARAAARGAVLYGAPTYKPPSDTKSSFIGAISFAVGAITDVIGLVFNPQKMKKWIDSMSQLKGYLDASGVGDELEEAITKPLLRGRLLDNLKILNDIQERQDADRHVESQLKGDGAGDMEREVREGHRFMRFATAAYGVEMIKSAIDVEVAAKEMSSHKETIATHTGLRPEDVRYLYSKDDGEEHILHHFVAVDETTKSVVLALRGTLSLSGAVVDVQGMARDFCLGLAHKGMCEMAEGVWEASGEAINALLAEEALQGYGLIITGHSLGGRVACLLNVMCHVDKLVGDRKVTCYAFAPPPTYSPCNPDATGDGVSDSPELVAKAIQNCTAYIHDNDAVPFLSIASVRRLALLLDTVDNITEHMWFWLRWAIYHEYIEIPEAIFDAVAEAKKSDSKCVDGEAPMRIPARAIVWAKKSVLGKGFEGYLCDPTLVAQNTVYVSPDMISDHLCEMYEDALDDLLEQ